MAGAGIAFGYRPYQKAFPIEQIVFILYWILPHNCSRQEPKRRLGIIADFQTHQSLEDNLDTQL